MASLQLPPPVFLTSVPTTHTKLKRACDKLGSVTAGTVHIPILCDLTAYWVRGHFCTDSFSNLGQPIISPPNTCVDGMPFKVQAFCCLFMIFKSLDSNRGDQSL